MLGVQRQHVAITGKENQNTWKKKKMENLEKKKKKTVSVKQKVKDCGNFAQILQAANDTTEQFNYYEEITLSW